ncbi:hypothetical protein LQR31_15175 [Chromobacterium vaccinii]|uniref:hypothetical protein n=1 Tax=Chromobacterium vaccinii TaxID=1108595 RepID=UPI001E54C30F|nr:hypothetical protein [Chromobacterium vaccinii]MCD4485816.1 hypothetical protein [Chromobacterium vaccinii]
MWSKTGIYAGLVCAALAAAGSASADEQPSRLVAADVAVQQHEMRGEVAAIDIAQRVVMLKGERGAILELPVASDVRNLERLKAGDIVRVRYRTAVALALKKGGDNVRKDVERTVRVQPQEGGKPGVVESHVSTLVSNVVALDRKDGVVTLEGPHGGQLDVNVRDPKLLDEVEVGNQVVAVITESAAVSIEPAL